MAMHVPSGVIAHGRTLQASSMRNPQARCISLIPSADSISKRGAMGQVGPFYICFAVQWCGMDVHATSPSKSSASEDTGANCLKLHAVDSSAAICRRRQVCHQTCGQVHVQLQHGLSARCASFLTAWKMALVCARLKAVAPLVTDHGAAPASVHHHKPKRWWCVCLQHAHSSYDSHSLLQRQVSQTKEFG
jgi:hypothetical protein